MSKNYIAYSFLTLAALFWSGNFIIGKFATLFEVPPLTLNFLRWVMVWFILIPFTIKEILAKKKYIKENGPPLGIYNIAGGNLGVSKAISEMNVKDHIVFVGHELNKNSRNLLENNKMDFVIGHDVELEIKVAFDKILDFEKNPGNQNSFFSDILIFNRYNCMDKKVY